MFLKSLNLKGFKSFGESTTLEFEPGFTLIVGPNGSGKSNVVDAVAWVLGAQGPRSLRSTKMDDVIFAGSASRPALGRAEVSLTIDNTAGLLPIDFSEVTITRTLFRSGDSEYSLNGVPCRLLDLQELLSDTGVGRQQHIIVAQGNLDSVLSARPEDRRLIIEEAAGVLKYRRRKERAERRLESTEGTLVRLQDLLREVRRQIRPLERQADAARRHGDLVDELVALRRYLFGRDLTAVEGRLASIERQRGELAVAEEEVRREVSLLDEEIARREGELESSAGASPEPALTDLLSRAEALRSRAASLGAVLEERRRWLDRSLQEADDRDLIAGLQAESSRLRDALQVVEAEAASLMPRAEELEQAEVELRAQSDALDARVGPTEQGSAGAPASRAAEARGELAALRSARARGEAESARASVRAAELAERLVRLEAEAGRLAGVVSAAEVEAQRFAEDEAEARRSEERGDAEEASAGDALRASDAELNRLQARAEVLGQAIERATAGRSESPSDLPSALGLLVELVDVDDGYEAAFEAAATDLVGATVVDGLGDSHQVVAALRESFAIGGILALPAADEAMPAEVGKHASTVPHGLEPLRGRVRSRSGPGAGSVERWLDSLLGSVAVSSGGWRQALDIAIEHEDVIVVTKEGDRFSSAGVLRWSRGGPHTTRAALEDARQRAAVAQSSVSAAEGRLAKARAAATEARARWLACTRALEAGASSRKAAEQALQRNEAERVELQEEIDAVELQRAERSEAERRVAERVAELEALMPSLDAAAEAEAERFSEDRAAGTRLAERVSQVAAMRRELEVRAAALKERRELTQRRLVEVEDRLSRHGPSDGGGSRRLGLEKAAGAATSLLDVVRQRLGVLGETVARLSEARRVEADASRRRSEDLEAVRRRRSGAERRLEEVREHLGRVRIDEAESKLKLESLVEQVRRELDCEPESVKGAACPELPTGTSAPTRRTELERELRLMGPINPLALEEHAALMDRHQFLESQLEDVRSARRELNKVIRAVDAEISEVFGAAFADVSENFEAIFAVLFPGGQGRLRLTDPEHVLDTGIEVEARPSGRNVKRLSLLSGGERSLVALAFLFAVFRSRPSPFYLLDEVEAALDDVNLHRFLDLLHEFREEAQLLIVSHQKRTMEIADCLYGVTMGPAGTSRVVSQRMSEAAAI